MGHNDDLPEKVLEKVDMGVHIHAGACVSVRVCGKVRAGERGLWFIQFFLERFKNWKDRPPH